MKKLIIFVSILLCSCAPVMQEQLEKTGANTQLKDMTQDNNLGMDSIFYSVDDPSGTPVDRKVTAQEIADTVLADLVAEDLPSDINAATSTVIDSGDPPATWYPIIVDGATGTQALETDTGLYFDPDSNLLYAGSFSARNSNPLLKAEDTDAPGSDKDAGWIKFEYIDGADGAENSDFIVQIIQGGVESTEVARFDESQDAWVIPTGKGLIFGTTQWDDGSDNIDADSVADGSTNAIITLTQETNLDTLVGSGAQAVGAGDAPTLAGTNFTGIPALVDECKGQTFQTFGSADTTPDVSNGGTGVWPCWQVHQSTSPTITDFDDGDDHSEYTAGDKFLLLVNYTAVIDFSDNSNIEGNANIDFTGSTSQLTYLVFQYDGTRWIEHALPGKSSPNVLSVDKISSKIVVVSDADGIDLTDSDCGKKIFMTGAGEVGVPDCDSALIGCVVVVHVRDASEQVEVVMYGDTTNDYFVLKDGTALDANDEADLESSATSDNMIYVFECLETNKWYVTAEDREVTDGGVAD